MKAYGFATKIEIKQTEKRKAEVKLRKRGWGRHNERGQSKVELRMTALEFNNA